MDSKEKDKICSKYFNFVRLTNFWVFRIFIFSLQFCNISQISNKICRKICFKYSNLVDLTKIKHL